MITKEKYKVSQSKTWNKVKCNTLFCREASHNIGTTLILDSELLNTTEHLNMRGFRYSDIYVPNPFVYDEIKRKNSRIKSFNCLLGNLINGNEFNYYNRVNNAWFDYMCTLDGNTDINPQQDVDDYFRKKIPVNGAFAVTFSYRKKTRANFLHEDLSRTNKLITSTAYKYGYTAVFCIHQIYKGMFFVLYKIHKN